MAIPNIQDFLGRGLAVPFGADADTGDIAGVSDEDNVRACVRFFMMTRQGELVFEKSFGLPPFLFENFDPGMADVITSSVTNGLARWEPRVLVRNVSVRRSDRHTVRITLSYVIRSTGELVTDTFDYDKWQGL